MNNVLKIILICILFATGAVFLIFSPFSKKQLSVEIKAPEVITQPVPSNPVPVIPTLPGVPHISPRPTTPTEPIPFKTPVPTEGVKDDISTIKSYTDLIADMFQKIFGAITSGLGIFLTIKQLKDKKKRA